MEEWLDGTVMDVLPKERRGWINGWRDVKWMSVRMVIEWGSVKV